MVYKIIDPDYCNSKYEDILKIGFEHSDYFGFLTIKYIHKKEHSNGYFKFLKSLESFEVLDNSFETPRYTSGQNLHFYSINKHSKQIVYDTLNFDIWNGYDYPADLVFYYKKKPWFRCISHERIILINNINKNAINKIEQLGLSFMKIDDSDYL